MKIKGWHWVVLAIIVFFLDLFTLGNHQVIDNQIINQIAFVIAVLYFGFFVWDYKNSTRFFFKK